MKDINELAHKILYEFGSIAVLFEAALRHIDHSVYLHTITPGNSKTIGNGYRCDKKGNLSIGNNFNKYDGSHNRLRT